MLGNFSSGARGMRSSSSGFTRRRSLSPRRTRKSKVQQIVPNYNPEWNHNGEQVYYDPRSYKIVDPTPTIEAQLRAAFNPNPLPVPSQIGWNPQPPAPSGLLPPAGYGPPPPYNPSYPSSCPPTPLFQHNPPPPYSFPSSQPSCNPDFRGNQ